MTELTCEEAHAILHRLIHPIGVGFVAEPFRRTAHRCTHCDRPLIAGQYLTAANGFQSPALWERYCDHECHTARIHDAGWTKPPTIGYRPCNNCGGTGIRKYTPNLDDRRSCSACDGTGSVEDAA